MQWLLNGRTEPATDTVCDFAGIGFRNDPRSRAVPTHPKPLPGWLADEFDADGWSTTFLETDPNIRR
jgi:hypothetical protein